MKKIILSGLMMAFSISLNAQTIFGVWENRDDETNKVDSYIEVFEKDGKAFAKIIEITDPLKQTNVCDLCEGSYKNKLILGMTILTNLVKDGDEWSDGEILDPKNGKVYDCYISLASDNKLKIRGFIGFSLLGRTAYWYRKKT